MTLFFISLALGMDAFSLGMVMGSRLRTNAQIATISLLVGMFHFLMPLLGMLIGGLVERLVGPLAVVFAGLLLMTLGAHILLQAWRSREEEPQHSIRRNLSLLSMVGFSFAVSVDSLSVGVSMGILPVERVLTAVFISVVAMILCLSGLWLGKKWSRLFRNYGEYVAGIILFVIGLKMIYVLFS